MPPETNTSTTEQEIGIIHTTTSNQEKRQAYFLLLFIPVSPNRAQLVIENTKDHSQKDFIESTQKDPPRKEKKSFEETREILETKEQNLKNYQQDHQ